jgi:TolB-like protein/Flp pilus assembly protein TadD
VSIFSVICLLDASLLDGWKLTAGRLKVFGRDLKSSENRSTGLSAATKVKFGPFCLDFERRELSRMGAIVPLGHRAIELLCALVAAKGALVTKDELLRLVWPGLTVEENNLQVQISALRKALQSGDDARDCVVTVPGRGYRFIGVQPPGDAEQAGADHLPPDKPSIVVLPFDNLSGDPEQQYFSDGIADDIAADLSKLSGLLVIARNSALVYRGRAVKVQEVSRELSVRYVLQGSVRKVGSRVRIVIQLIDGQTGAQLCAERYDRELTDIFTVQDEVTTQIVSALAVTLTQGDQRRLQRKDTDNLEAYDNYLRGRQLVFQRSTMAVEEARPLLERAIALDPQVAQAYTMLACTHILDHANGWHDAGGKSLERAREFAQMAVARDGDDPEAHWALGWTLLLGRQHDQAMAEVRTALRCDPNFALAHSLLGQVLYYSGRPAEALQPLATAFRLDPNNHEDPHLHYLAQAYFCMGRYEDAAAVLKRRIVRKPDTDMSRILLASCYGHLGRAEEARSLWLDALRINPGYSLEHRRRVLPYKDPADFEHMVEGLRKAGVPM